jgi:hypothetical protein
VLAKYVLYVLLGFDQSGQALGLLFFETKDLLPALPQLSCHDFVRVAYPIR